MRRRRERRRGGRSMSERTGEGREKGMKKGRRGKGR